LVNLFELYDKAQTCQRQNRQSLPGSIYTVTVLLPQTLHNLKLGSAIN